MELREYLQILKRRRWIVAGTLLAVLAAALVATLRTTPVYEASARVEVQNAPSSSTEAAQILEAMVEPARRLQTQVELIKGEGVLSRAAKDLKLPSTEDLHENLEVKLVPDTQIIQLFVRHPRPEEARDWANAVANAYIADRQERAVERTTLATGPLDRGLEEVRGKIAEQDAAIAKINETVAAAQANRDRLSAELSTVEGSLSVPAAPAPTINNAALGRVEEINRRLTELDSIIRTKQAAGEPTTAEEAEKARLEAELADQRKALLQAGAAAGPDPALVKRADDLRAQISALEAQIRSGESQLSGPEGERDTLATQLAALQVQRQSLPDADVVRQSGGAVVTAAETPNVPASPKLGLNMALALALGLMLGVGFAFLAENLDDRVRGAEEVEERVGAPVLGHVPYVEEWVESPDPLLATVHEPTSGASEAYRTLRTNLRFLSLERPLQTVLVTSTLKEEGKSTTAANLAVALAEGGMQTILVSADLRRPSAHKFFDLPDTGGIVAALDGGSSVEDALQETDVPNLRVLPAGGHPPNPTEILASSRFTEVLESLASLADIVLIDAPPVLGLADASALASKVDGVLFVVDAHEVPRRSLSHAAEQIRKAGGRLLGTIINGVEPHEGGYGYYYQYYYAYADEQQAERGRPLLRKAGREKNTGRDGADADEIVDLDADQMEQKRR